MSVLPVILIVEDEDFLRSSLADFLEDHGYVVLTAPNAENGLEQLAHDHPDVCIVDIRLPDMNGNEFILRARHESRNRIPHLHRITGIQPARQPARIWAERVRYSFQATLGHEYHVGQNHVRILRNLFKLPTDHPSVCLNF